MAAPARPPGPLGDSISSGSLGSSPSGRSLLFGISKKASDSEISQFLKNVPYFRSLNEDLRKKISKEFIQERLDDNRILFEQNTPADSAFIICSGQIQILDQGKQQAVLGPTETLGEMTLFSNERRTATAKAIGSTILLKITHIELRKLIDKHPEVKNGILTVLVNKVITSNKNHPGLLISDKKSLSDNSPAETPHTAKTESYTSPRIQQAVDLKPSKEDEEHLSQVRRCYHLVRKIIKASQSIAVISNKVEVEEAKAQLQIAQAKLAYEEVCGQSREERKGKSRSMAIDESRQALTQTGTTQNKNVRRIKASELDLKNEQASDMCTVLQKVHSIFLFINHFRLPLIECVKLLYATASHKNLKNYFLNLKPICDQFFHEETQTKVYQIYQQALVIYKLREKNGSVKRSEVKHTLHVADLLKKSALFNISFIQRLLVVLTSEEIVIEAEKSLFKEGDPGDCMYFIIEGEIRIHGLVDGVDKNYEIYKKGQCFGELALLGNNRAASVTTITKTALLKISAEEFQRLLKEIPKMTISIFNELARMIKKTNDAKLAAEKGSPIPRLGSKDGVADKRIHLELKFPDSELDRFKADPPLNDQDVFNQPDIEERADSTRLPRKKLLEVRKQLEKTSEDDKEFKRIQEVLKEIYLMVSPLQVKFDEIKIYLEDIVRVCIPTENASINFHKITVNNNLFYIEAEKKENTRKFTAVDFFTELLKTVFPGLESKTIERQVQTLINGRKFTSNREGEQAYIAQNPIETLNFLKSITSTMVWSPIHNFLKSKLLPTYSKDPYKIIYSGGVDMDISEPSADNSTFKTTLSSENFRVKLTRKIHIVDSKKETFEKDNPNDDTLKMEPYYAEIPIQFTLQRLNNNWDFSVEIPKDVGIEPGFDFELYSKILHEVKKSLADIQKELQRKEERAILEKTTLILP